MPRRRPARRPARARSGGTRRPAAPSPSASGGPATLRVSAATARILRRGHPWVLPDRATGSLTGLRAGDPVVLTAADGTPLALALADPGARAVARVVGPPDAHFDAAARARAALTRRRALLDDPRTDVVRVIHGEADGLPGLTVDRYGDALVAVRQARCITRHTRAVYGVLRKQIDVAAVWEKDHFDDLRRQGIAGRAVFGAPTADEQRVVRELGVRYAVAPFGGLATGLYADQRDNRERLRARGPFDHVLNLFAYSGAFSISLLAAGSRRAVDVDLSGPALRTARHNAELNGIEPDRHRTAREDAAGFVARHRGDPFDLAIVDPPTAARGGRGWSVRADLPALLRAVTGVLADRATLLVCVNDRRADPRSLRTAVRAAVVDAGRTVTALDAAPPSADYPALRGFDEARSFVGVLATVTR